MIVSHRVLFRICCFAVIYFATLQVFAQARYALHASDQLLYQNNGWADYPYAAKWSSITFGGGFSGASGVSFGRTDAAATVTYTIVGVGVLRLADRKGMVEFFEDEPRGVYSIILNHHGGQRFEYHHNPEHLDWQRQLAAASGSSGLIRVLPKPVKLPPVAVPTEPSD